LQKIEDCECLQGDFESVVLGGDDACSAMDAMGRFLHILATLFPRMRFDSYQTVDERIVNAVRYIESHYDTPLRVPELASACHISPSYFYECFKSQMGVSPIEYKNRILIAHARRSLIDHPETPIEELSERLGSESSIYFRRLFKRFTGKTPREYRAGTKEEI
jgi:AraC-like DNA-binding protein